jgi:hypothetical protein
MNTKQGAAAFIRKHEGLWLSFGTLIRLLRVVEQQMQSTFCNGGHAKTFTL